MLFLSILAGYWVACGALRLVLLPDDTPVSAMPAATARAMISGPFGLLVAACAALGRGQA